METIVLQVLPSTLNKGKWFIAIKQTGKVMGPVQFGKGMKLFQSKEDAVAYALAMSNEAVRYVIAD